MEIAFTALEKREDRFLPGFAALRLAVRAPPGAFRRSRRQPGASDNLKPNQGESGMGDIIYLGVLIAFFALAWLLVHACERIIGSEDHPHSPRSARL